MGITFPLWSPTIGDVSPALINDALGSDGIANTSITTAGAGTLTAAGLVGGQITRTGPTAAYTDTTDTAANIYAALGSVFQSGDTFLVRIKNLTAFPQTISAGTGVTWSAVTVIPPMSVGNYFMTIGGSQSAPTFTTSHMSTVPMYTASAIADPLTTTLATNGAGTITAAGIAGGVTLRTTVAAAATDTTDTVANILAAAFSSVAAVGAAFEWTYVNNSAVAMTLAGASSVTITGQTVIPPNSWARYLVTLASATTITLVSTGSGYFPSSGTFVANQTSAVTVSNTAVTATSVIIITLKTVGGTVGNSGPAIKTITPGTGFTVTALASDTSTYSYTILG